MPPVTRSKKKELDDITRKAAPQKLLEASRAAKERADKRAADAREKKLTKTAPLRALAALLRAAAEKRKLAKETRKAAAQKGLETKRAKKILADKRAAEVREKGIAKAAPLRAAAEKRKADAEKRKEAARRGAETRRAKKATAAKGGDL